MNLLTFRLSQSGRVAAAYLGACRVGYVDAASRGPGYVWHTSLLRPEGGAAAGRVPTMEDGQLALECSVQAWLEAAGLDLAGPTRDRPTEQLGAAKTKVPPARKKKVASSKKSD